ncbi:MAG TPA: hypothetical protein VM487_09630 [Phycisphaerae bacterium]|nr:hypothetical protein [Phycisphaerae bacterium]
MDNSTQALSVKVKTFHSQTVEDIELQVNAWLKGTGGLQGTAKLLQFDLRYAPTGTPTVKDYYAYALYVE